MDKNLSRADLTEAESKIKTLCERQWSPENENQTNGFMVNILTKTEKIGFELEPNKDFKNTFFNCQ